MFPPGCRRFTGLIVAVLLSLAASGARSQSSDIEREWRLLQQAQSAHDRGRAADDRGDSVAANAELSAASDLYRQLIEQYPLRRDLYAPLADTLIRRGNSAAAYAMLVQQVRGGNRERSVALQLVRALVGIHQFRRALEEVQKLTKSDPKSPLLQALLGEVAADAGEHDLAIVALGQALAQPLQKSLLAEVNLNQTALRLRLVRLLLSAHRLPEAAATLAPLAQAQNPEALLLLGQLHLDGGKLNEAVAVLRRCLAAPGSEAQRSHATALLAQALSRSGKTSEAIAALRQAGEDPTVLLALADLYMRDQPPNPAAALMVVERAAQAAPKSQRVCLEHASLLEQNQNVRAALSELQRCFTLAPTAGDSPQEALLLRASVELRLGRLDEGISSLRTARSQPGAPADLTVKLARALLRRGLRSLAKPAADGEEPATTAQATAQATAHATDSPALSDLNEANRLAPSPTMSWALGLGLLAAGKATEAQALLSPLCEKPTAEPRLLAACARSLRESGQHAQALSLLQRAETLLPPPAPGGSSPLRAALRQEQATTLIALRRPLDALKLLEGKDAEAQRARAQALMATVRAFYGSATSGPKAPSTVTSAGIVAGQATAGRGPFPPLRGPMEQAQLRMALSQGVATRGPFPPLRGGSDQPESAAPMTASFSPPPQGLSDERQVLSYAQLALRSGTLTPSERAEAMLYQVAALFHGGQVDIALRLLGEIATQFDLLTLTGLLGQGGFADLKARLALRGGDFYQGVGIAQQALPLLKPAAARSLQTTMAAAYTNKAIELIERNEVDRANSLLRAAWVQAQGGPPENVARANYNLAVLQLHRGKLEDARTALSRLDPQLLPEVWLGLGSYYDLRSDGRSALEAYRHYLQSTGPGDPQLPRVRQWVDVLERIYEAAQP